MLLFSFHLFQYVLNTMAPHPTHDVCEILTWRTALPNATTGSTTHHVLRTLHETASVSGSGGVTCVLASTSVQPPHGVGLLGGVPATVLSSRYLTETRGAGSHVSRRLERDNWLSCFVYYISVVFLYNLLAFVYTYVILSKRGYVERCIVFDIYDSPLLCVEAQVVRMCSNFLDSSMLVILIYNTNIQTCITYRRTHLHEQTP
jgi:hypothetical protein